ncbi:MAG TPA: hypothetical protein VGW12_16350 [Pyrinomonadaceae bacterium]|nr:hypothetical protein [Pyrinomonadaceae bacterium]
MLTQKRRTPYGLLVCAVALLFIFATDASAQKTCKPRVDKNNIAVELVIPNFNGGQRVVLSMPAKAKEMRAFGGAVPNQSAHHPSPVSYSVLITQKNDNGVTLDLNVQMQNKNGGWQMTRRTIVLPFETIVEQRYMTGVQVKAYFKLRPFNCKSL